MRNVVLILLKLIVLISLTVTVGSLIGLYTVKSGAAWVMFGGIALLVSMPVWIMAKILLAPREVSGSFINSDR